MPTLSQKSALMPASPIRKLVPYGIQAKERGVKVYHLNIGQPDIETPQTALNAIKDIHLKVLDYSLSEGNLEYRQTLAKYYRSFGISNITADNFRITNGGSEALHFALSCVCDEGDEIIIPEPYYANYNGFSTALGIKVVPVVSDIQSGFALPPISSIEDKINSKTKAILICNPGNPTGYVYSQSEMEQLKDIALKHDIFIIADEVYREYVYDDDTPHTSVLSLSGMENHAIVIDSESKRYSMCGVRIGAMVTQNTELLDASMKFAQARLSPVLIGQIAATAAHQDDADYLASVKKEYKKRRDLAVTLLNEIDGVFCPTPKGAFYCMAEFPVDNTDDFAQWLLEKFQYQNETVMLAPASGFYSQPEKGLKQARLAYVLNENDLTKACTILKKALETYNA